MVSFINRGSFTPTRREYADYLTWAAAKVQDHEGIEVAYGEEVLRVDGEEDGEVVTILSRSKEGQEITRTGSRWFLNCRNASADNTSPAQKI